jgi:hypothetical protein
MKRQAPSEEVEIQPADPAARARALWLVLVILILGGALLVALYFHEERISEWAREHLFQLAQQPTFLFLVAFVLMLPLVGAAVHVYRLAGRVVTSQRMPPPGQKVIKDTPIITGSKAVRQGRSMQVIAVLMAVIGILFPFGLAIIVMMIQKGT